MKNYKFLLLGLLMPSKTLGRIHARARESGREDANVAGPEQQINVDINDGIVDDVEILFYDQLLDHFSDSDTTTFKQRYFCSSRYVASENTMTSVLPPLAFLCVGSQGKSLDQSVLIDSNHCTGDMVVLAEKLHVEQNRDVHLFSLGGFLFTLFVCCILKSIFFSHKLKKYDKYLPFTQSIDIMESRLPPNLRHRWIIPFYPPVRQCEILSSL